MSDGRASAETVEGTSRLAQWQTTINGRHRAKNLVGDLRNDGVAERLQPAGAVWHAFGDSRDVWLAVEMSVHPSG